MDAKLELATGRNPGLCQVRPFDLSGIHRNPGVADRPLSSISGLSKMFLSKFCLNNSITLLRANKSEIEHERIKLGE